MLKKLFLTFTLLASSLTAHAARVHIFSGYSNPDASFQSEKQIPLPLSWKAILPSGVGVNFQPSKRIMSELSLFFPDFWRGWITNESNSIKSNSLTGIFDLNAKMILPIPKRFTRTVFYFKTGPWLLHQYKYTQSKSNPKPIKQQRAGYGLTLGFGGIITLPFWPRLPLEASAAYSMPIALPNAIDKRLPENESKEGFLSVKLGLIWPR